MSICGAMDDEQGVQYLVMFYHSGHNGDVAHKDYHIIGFIAALYVYIFIYL
jgi:hypothetical protein